jgi:hypothetical protein
MLQQDDAQTLKSLALAIGGMVLLTIVLALTAYALLG